MFNVYNNVDEYNYNTTNEKQLINPNEYNYITAKFNPNYNTANDFKFMDQAKLKFKKLMERVDECILESEKLLNELEDILEGFLMDKQQK